MYQKSFKDFDVVVVVVVLHSLQLPEQKEGLFLCIRCFSEKKRDNSTVE